MCHKIKKFSNGLMNHFPRYWVKIPKFNNYHPPPTPVARVDSMTADARAAMTARINAEIDAEKISAEVKLLKLEVNKQPD